MAEKYIIHRSNDYDLRYQISAGLNSLSTRLGGPDNPAGPPAYDAINMRWRDTWVQQQYYTGDCVVDGLWLMIANIDTVERPAPQPIAPPQWTIDYPGDPPWSSTTYTGSVFSGISIVVPDEYMYALTSIRVWIEDAGSADARYQTVVINHLTGAISVGSEFTGDIVPTPQWVTVNITPLFLFHGDDFSILLHQWNSASNTAYDMPYTYTGGTQQNNTPGGGNWNVNNQATSLRVAYIDGDAVDRSAQLDTIGAGSSVRCVEVIDSDVYVDFQIIGGADQGGWYLYDVGLVGQGPGGIPAVGEPCRLLFLVPIAVPTTYVWLTDEYLDESSFDGYLSFDSLSGGTNTDDAYGIDVQFEAFLESEDWDIMALSSTQLPNAGATPEPAQTVNATPAFYNVDHDLFLSRFTAQEQENWAKLTNKTIYAAMPPPSWADVFSGQAIQAYVSERFVNVRDPVVWFGIIWLETMEVIGPGRAAIILAP
jgi:hypothetical protein